MQEQNDLHQKDSERLFRIRSWYHHYTFGGHFEESSVISLISDLIIQNNYGQALADLLDLYYKNYMYEGEGIYAPEEGYKIHNVPRHLCEPGVTKEEAEAKNYAIEPRSFISLYWK